MTLIVYDTQDSGRFSKIEGDGAACKYIPGRDHVGSSIHAAYYAALEQAGFEPDTFGERYRVGTPEEWRLYCVATVDEG